MHWVFPSFRFQWLADEVRRNLPLELDFRCEAHNQDKFSAMFKHLGFAKVGVSQAQVHVHVTCIHVHAVPQAPKVHWDLTTPRLLTMEFCEGAKVDDKAYLKKHKIRGDEVSQG